MLTFCFYLFNKIRKTNNLIHSNISTRKFYMYGIFSVTYFSNWNVDSCPDLMPIYVSSFFIVTLNLINIPRIFFSCNTSTCLTALTFWFIKTVQCLSDGRICDSLKCINHLFEPQTFSILHLTLSVLL